MGDRPTLPVPTTAWPRVFLTGTALSIGLVASIRGASSGLSRSSELLTAVLVVGLYTALSVFYYATASREPPRVRPTDEL
ncbi:MULTISPECIES: hypothetical protein [Halorussus]|uniref:hypothetical protein n=1 Tax=Halorussus TaxID=1070314 RepID=UPI000E21203C|nr:MULTISPECIES: hypothetical protein [Halorussus]NHN61014.1 hypothetical protein [Halorussus sp. JP-T4]